MLWMFWSLVVLVVICTGLLLPTLWRKIDETPHASRTVNDPKTLSTVAVRFRALRAAFAGLTGKPKE